MRFPMRTAPAESLDVVMSRPHGQGPASGSAAGHLRHAGHIVGIDVVWALRATCTYVPAAATYGRVVTCPTGGAALWSQHYI